MNHYQLRLIPLGGITDVTKNMYVYELYKDGRLQDIIIVDCGVGFPKQKELGVDLTIPDISYLTGEGEDGINKLDKIRAIVFTHGHEDHISGLSYLYDKLGQPPLYASKLTSVFLRKKLEEKGYRQIVNVIKYRQNYQFGDFKIRFISMTHSIPDTTHLVILTPAANVYHGSDFKLDLTPPYSQPPDFYEITRIGKEGVMVLLSDCLGSEREGLTLSESAIGKTFEEEIRTTRGKFIMTTFSSNISRIRQCVEAAVKFNRKICFLGRSMKENTASAKEIGYLPIPYNFIIKEEQIKNYPPSKICLVVAGSQGQYHSALAKIARNDNSNVKIAKGDKIIFSSDPIPGNEEEVYDLVEDLIKKGADVIYPSISEQLHASGHGNIEDLKFLIRMINPQYFIPIGGTFRHQRQYQRLVKGLGYNEKKVFLLNEGETINFERGKAYLGEKINTKTIYVDAYGVGDVGNIVLRDRQNLANEGIVVVIIPIDKSLRLLTAPKIITRGFVFEKQEQKLIKDSQHLIEKILRPNKGEITNLNNLRKEIIIQLEQFFFEKKGRKPLIIVDILSL